MIYFRHPPLHSSRNYGIIHASSREKNKPTGGARIKRRETGDKKMAIQTTQREATRRNDLCISVGYCDLWHTLKECADGKDAYTAGVYGWNADIYEFDTFAIVTGYRPFGKDILSHEFCKKWEKKAQAHYNKVNAILPNGKFRSCAVRGRMRYTFRTHFTKAVHAEIAKWREAKGGKRKAA